MQGLLEGNRMVRDKPDAVPRRRRAGVQVDAATRRKTELANVHLSNLPENLAFFSGAIDAAGSFGGIYQSAVLAYGSDLIKDPPDAEPLRRAWRRCRRSRRRGIFKDQKVAIAPIRTGGGASVESDPLLSKDIRFLFEPNSATLDMANQDNVKNLEAIKKLLQVSPGSTLLLRGHVDNAMVDEFRKTGRRGLRAHAGAARDGAEQEPRRRDPQAAGREVQHRRQAHRHRRPRLGRAGRDRTRIRTGASRCSGSRSSE